MIYTDKTILESIDNKNILIHPFIGTNVGTNSVDLTLNPKMLVYKNAISYNNRGSDFVEISPNRFQNVGLIEGNFLDCREKNETVEIDIPEEGYILLPGQLYIASTNEYTETHNAVPIIEGKCFVKGTQIVMFDESLKNIQDIVVGDLIMGVDGLPKKVKSTHFDFGEIFEVSSKKCESYFVNKQHELVLYTNSHSGNKKYKEGVNVISVKDFMESSKTVKKSFRVYKKAIPYSNKAVNIDPYVLGVWLGDGTSSNCNITINTDDILIINYIKEIYKNSVLHQYKPNAFTLNISDNPINTFVQNNSFLTALRDYGLVKNKHIPEVYKKSSIEQRLKLLAGLIDTDGYKNRTAYEITQKSSLLINDIKEICESLGFICNIGIKEVNGETYYRLTIVGDLNIIPVIIDRKKLQSPNGKSKNLGISVSYSHKDYYYGFELEAEKEEDRLFFLKDGIVVHNSSLGRLGLSVHVTAGFGDVGFCGTWTLELTVEVPLKIYPNMKICQLSYHSITDKPLVKYSDKSEAKYAGQNGATASLMHENFIKP